MQEAKSDHFNWWLPISGALAALILAMPTLFWGNDASAFFLSIPLIILIAVISLVVAVTRFRRQGVAALVMLCVFVIVAASLLRVSDRLRTAIRWLAHSQSYKAQVLSQPTSHDGSLQHIEWDGWGFPGAGDTTVYLVNDPDDGLEEASKKGSPGKFAGIPCGAVRVRRLEDHWYTVLFYTDTDWTHCA